MGRGLSRGLSSGSHSSRGVISLDVGIHLDSLGVQHLSAVGGKLWGVVPPFGPTETREH